MERDGDEDDKKTVLSERYRKVQQSAAKQAL